MNRKIALLAVLALPALLVGLPRESAAQETTSAHASSSAMVSAGARVGVIAPQPFSELGSFAVAGVEAGYFLPMLERRIQVSAAFLYSRPPASGSGDDSRLSGGGYEWDLDQQMMIAELGGVFRILPPGESLVPFARVAGRVYALDTSLDGNSMDEAAFGEHTEGATEVGMVIGGGVDWALGPGSLIAQLDLGFSDMNEKLTGDSNTGAFEVTAGYRFFF